MSEGAVSGLRQFLTNENPLKMMKNAFYFNLEVFIILKIFKFLYFSTSFPHFPDSKGQMEVE